MCSISWAWAQFSQRWFGFPTLIINFFYLTVLLLLSWAIFGDRAASEAADPAHTSQWNNDFNIGLKTLRPLPEQTLRTKQTQHEPVSEMEEIPLEPDLNSRESKPSPVNKPSAMQGDAAKLWVTNICVEGSRLLTPDQIHTLVAPYENQTQTVEALNQLTAQITTYYREKGYLTTEAYLPPQEIANGQVKIQVREGTVGNFQLEGNHFYRTSVIRHQLSLKQGALFDFKKLEAELNRMNRQQTGYQVKAFLSQGANAGETNINLKVAERQPLQISPTWDNQGRYFTGLYREGVEVRHDSLLGLSDRFYFRGLLASGTRIGMASYSIPLNHFGTTLTTTGALSHVDVTLPVPQPPSIVGHSASVDISLTQPLDRARHWQLETGVLFQRSVSLFEQVQTSRNEVHALQSALSFERGDRWGYSYNRLQNTVAFRGSGANTSFWKIENYFNRTLYLPHNNLLLLKAYGQWTPDALPGIQQFQLGGLYSVRGFTEGVLIGDRGFNVGIEHRFPIPGLRRMNPWLGQRVQGAWFYDFGRVWKDSSNPTYNPAADRLATTTMLQGLGFGFRAQITRFLQGYIDVGFGLGNRKDIEPQHRQPTARVHVGVRSNLLSQDYKLRNTLPKTVSNF